jgi:hypothetical protein
MKIYLLQAPQPGNGSQSILMLIMFLIFGYFFIKKIKDNKGWWSRKICPNCRNKINSYATICQHCHSKLD